jgi:hypothetical protein
MPALTDHGHNLWTIDHALVVAGLHIGTRTSLMGLDSGGLVVHSPGPIRDLQAAGIESLGFVAAIVAPNLMHHFYLAECANAFPEARVFGPPGLTEKLKGSPELETLEHSAPELWQSEIEQIFVPGVPRVNEFAFHHRPSRTLLLTDVAFNMQRSDSLLTQIFMRLNGAWQKLGPSRLMRSMIKDRKAVREAIDQILLLDFDRVVVTHGDVLETRGKEALARGFDWLEA